MDKKIVFFDIDGTLVDFDKKIPLSTKVAIQQLKENGVYVAIATGRAPYMFENIRKELGIESFVSFNGQYVVFEGQLVYDNPLGQEELKRLYNASLAGDYPMIFMGAEEMRASQGDSKYIKESFDSLKFNYPDVDPEFYDDRSIYQALLFCERDAEKAFQNVHTSFRFLRWHDLSCDIMPDGGSKAIGVQKLIEASGLKVNDTYAFGDGLNDIEMIEEIGTGIAMGNAVHELKKIADYVTADVGEEGIYKALKHLHLI
ncbi:Cof-type HAD-IIB family hydrolase [Virgibacillus oceani]|uniref:Phosphatase n=1 Tax=Virgibacillus oceani TaxID=1479511 RepID=A0A917M1B0_9BACI|nr:Cof-type HAD-IIB family hydrolase [Virgibacillus oceani]GGG70212.1 phosphatase [Virgibacillus oceani]